MLIHYELVSRWGKQYAEAYEVDEQGKTIYRNKRNPWLFPVSDETRSNYHYVADVDKYVRNTSIN